MHIPVSPIGCRLSPALKNKKALYPKMGVSAFICSAGKGSNDLGCHFLCLRLAQL